MLEHKGNFRNPIDQVEFIKEHFECGGITSFIRNSILIRKIEEFHNLLFFSHRTRRFLPNNTQYRWRDVAK